MGASALFTCNPAHRWWYYPNMTRDETIFIKFHDSDHSRAWRALHLTGSYYLLFQFTVSFGKRVPDMPLYALFVIPLVAVFVLRMISMASKPSPRPAQAG
jgi:hypothetical protein